MRSQLHVPDKVLNYDLKVLFFEWSHTTFQLNPILLLWKTQLNLVFRLILKILYLQKKGILITKLEFDKRKQELSNVCPGVCRTFVETLPIVNEFPS
jgi:hypothetical protein